MHISTKARTSSCATHMQKEKQPRRWLGVQLRTKSSEEKPSLATSCFGLPSNIVLWSCGVWRTA
eukprot:3092997-Amphidinium_carterae.1